jgi:hypothetical protein
MPLTLWLAVSGIIIYFYLRRANLGIDVHHPKITLNAGGVKKQFPVILPAAPAPGGGFYSPSLSDSGGGGTIN